MDEPHAVRILLARPHPERGSGWGVEVPFLDLLTEYGSPWGQHDDAVEGSTVSAGDARHEPV